MGQDYTGLLKLRSSRVELDALLAFQRAYGLAFSASNTRWMAEDDRLRLEAAPLTELDGFAADVAGTRASRHAEFDGEGFALGLGFHDHGGARSALLTVTERDFCDFVAALSPRGEDMLTYLAALSSRLDVESFALGRNVDASALDAFLRGEGAAEGVCVASRVPASSEQGLRARARVTERVIGGQHLLFSWLPGHERYFG